MNWICSDDPILDEVIVPVSGVGATQTTCEGVFFDSGGSLGNYGNNEDGQLTIAPTGATSVELTIVSFDVNGGVDCAEDWVKVYDGSDLAAPLIGTYCNDNPPPASIVSSGGAITVVFHSNDASSGEGFEMNWLCNDDPIIDDSGVEESQLASLVSIYPNPSAGQISIDLSTYDEPVQIEVLNELGQVVYISQLTAVLTTIELSNLAKGMYWITLSTSSEVFTTKLFIATN